MAIGFISNNAFSVALGISMVVTGLIISYQAQKRLFGKYRNKVKSAVEKDDQQS